ncbi:DUF397 domain-containing protein [Spirillospora sp. NPDC049652]
MTEWRKSSHSSSTGGDCVEVARLAPNTVGIRDSKNPEGPRFALQSADARALADVICAGEHDLV